MLGVHHAKKMCSAGNIKQIEIQKENTALTKPLTLTANPN